MQATTMRSNDKSETSKCVHNGWPSGKCVHNGRPRPRELLEMKRDRSAMRPPAAEDTGSKLSVEPRLLPRRWCR